MTSSWDYDGLRGAVAGYCNGGERLQLGIAASGAFATLPSILQSDLVSTQVTSGLIYMGSANFLTSHAKPQTKTACEFSVGVDHLVTC